MKASVDASTCTGCTLCCDIAADVFQMGDDGLAHAKAEEVPAAAEASAKEAADSCPVGAITVG
ncbi:MAG: ferredoxin [Kiritimatiellae bacterium]|jgi:ferredoxin|nr:ferredoxin [Kiritimatiellia bacterium]NLD89396.1 ferredoxin [Lentisphaerota bacterium]HOU21120.1 ferredoxin [Kiritimatiellia bacterium]HPC19117.1 ferredoxin [Kiritimatiellia bacterium]HQN79826.1 ferredoxin [Kiritimatiellia bacterium]